MYSTTFFIQEWYLFPTGVVLQVWYLFPTGVVCLSYKSGIFSIWDWHFFPTSVASFLTSNGLFFLLVWHLLPTSVTSSFCKCGIFICYKFSLFPVRVEYFSHTKCGNFFLSSHSTSVVSHPTAIQAWYDRPSTESSLVDGATRECVGPGVKLLRRGALQPRGRLGGQRVDLGKRWEEK